MASTLKMTGRGFGAAALLWVWLLALASLCGAALAATDHKVFFKDTDYELHVYEIRGDLPGATLLIIGGMHNEPGGYLSADRYTDFSLHKGNLIVVPRANVPVIVTNNREIHGDMNRKFTNGDQGADLGNYEESVVDMLKALMARSTALLNLHDGTGFYRPEWESPLKNPQVWGQSIITDTDDFVTPNGSILHLKDRVDRVLARVNPDISLEEHRFRHNNTRTFKDDSYHREQRSSATFFALTQYGIEAYGVETSKNIDSLSLKVQYQSLVIDAFMDEFGIIPNKPKVKIDEPQLQYLLISVNDNSFPFGVPNNQTLYVKPGDKIRIQHIAANYERGLVADVEGLGSLNDLNKDLIVDKPLTVLVKKDQFECGKVYLDLKADLTPPAERKPVRSDQVDSFQVLVNGESRRIASGDTLEITPEDILVIQDIAPVTGDYDRTKVNFVGFVGNKRVNDTEDRGYRIQAKDLWKRHSLNKQGKLYKVEAILGDKVIGEMRVRVADDSEP